MFGKVFFPPWSQRGQIEDRSFVGGSMFSSDKSITHVRLDQLPPAFIGRPMSRDRRWPGFLGSLFIVGCLTTCEAVGVPKTNDPAAKLDYARSLLDDDRALPAERLIDESMAIYRKKGDRGGLADAQYLYAKFLAGDAVQLTETWYRENGFRDSRVTFDKRREEAVRNFQLAANGFSMTGNFADATNAYFDLGLVQANNDNHTAAACGSFSESLTAYYSYFQWDPKPEARVPANYDSYEDLMITVAAAAGCIESQSADGPSDGDGRNSDLSEDAHLLAAILGPNRQTAIPGMRKLAVHHDVQHRFDQAERNLRAALALSRQSDTVDNNRTMAIINDLSQFHVDRRQLVEAESLAREALDLGETSLGKNHRHTLNSMANLATAIKLQRRPDEAESIYREALDLSTQAWGETDSATLQRMRDLGFFYYGQGRYVEAERVYLELVQGVIATYGEGGSYIRSVREELANILRGQGRLAEASRLREQILRKARVSSPNNSSL